MGTGNEKSTVARKWWLWVAAFVAFVLAFDLLDSLVRNEPGPPGEGAATGPGAEQRHAPAPPEIRMREDGGVEIRHDFFRRTTIRMNSEAEDRALFDCLTQGIERVFGEGTEGWSRSRVRQETQRLQDQCLGAVPGWSVPTPSGADR